MILGLKLDHDIEAKTGRLDNLKGNERNRDFLGRKKEEPWDVMQECKHLKFGMWRYFIVPNSIMAKKFYYSLEIIILSYL